MEDALVKLIVIGDSLVGKTSFINRYVNNVFRPDYKSTIGVDFSLKMITWANRVKVKLQLWDIAGQERFTFMTRNYYKDAKGCLLLFDLGSPASFERARRWKADLDSKIRCPDGSLLPCLLVGNKCDLAPKEVSTESMSQMCRELNFLGWTETSAKDGLMINETISFLIDVVMGKPMYWNLPVENGLTESVRLGHRHSNGKPEHNCLC